MAQIVWFLLKYACGGLVSYAAPRLLVAAGVPLDRWIVDLAGLSTADALWTATVLVALVLFFADRLWHSTQSSMPERAPGLVIWAVEKIRNVFHKDIQAQTRAVASVEAKHIPVRSNPDITFKDALRHFAYHSRWAHDFEHPKGDWMTAEYWPQAVHREFCQPLIDSDIVARGVRRERGKQAENGRTKIPADFWRTADFDVPATLESPETLDWARDRDGTSYSRILFKREQIEETWPAVGEDAVSAIETAAKEWWRLRTADIANSHAQMDEQVEQSRLAKSNAPFREISLAEALGWVVYGEWGRPFHGLSVAAPWGPNATELLAEFTELAKAGKLTMWGKRLDTGIFVRVPQKHWEKHRLTVADAMGIGQVAGGAAAYNQLMLNRAEVEREWPHEK